MSNSHFSTSNTLILLALLFYFHPYSNVFAQLLDEHIFFILNGSLKYSVIWQYVVMAMNHKYEKIVVPVVFLTINILIILSAEKKDRIKFISYTIVTFLFLELAIALNYYLFSELFTSNRLSPSLVLKPFISLTDIFSNPLVKTVSKSSFPGDHAFVTSCWAIVTWHYAQDRFKAIITFVAVCIIPARLIGGAHWFSDVAFSILFAYFLSSYLIGTYVWGKLTKSLESTIKKYLPKHHKKKKA